MSERITNTTTAAATEATTDDTTTTESDLEHFTKNGFKTLMEAIKHSNALPSGRDWDFYNTSESFKGIINNESNNVLRLMNHLMQSQDIDSNIRNRVLDEKIELIIEANDNILEKVANNIDEMNGVRKTNIAPVVLQTVSAQLPVNGSWNRPSAATFSVSAATSQSPGKNNCIKLLTAKNIVRPQKFFKDQLDNRNKIPWYPRITDKPNSLKPLAIFLEECEDRQEFSHPYEHELYRFTPTPEQLLAEEPTLPKSLYDTSLIEVDKPEQLDELVETLRNCKEFAVDVEHHSYRSFMGITCLLQISTEDKDYLIDALALRDKLSILNEVFTKNNIVKVFHGADRDIEWLQRDLSIYVVNMFDTYQAAKMLEYQSLSLAFLMKKFCNVVPNKQYQLADWRIRPLPDELKQYAREDTHYLIYIYKILKNELLARSHNSDNLVRAAIESSTSVCKKRYFKPILHDDSHLEVLRKCKKMFDNRQLYALKEIFMWRDLLAREDDESCGYVLPNHMMIQISETLPREMQGILACCNPVPPLVKANLLHLHQIVLKAREQPLEQAIMKDTTGRGVLKEISKVNVDSALHCPHDLSKSQEFRDDLPTLLKSEVIQADVKNVGKKHLDIEKASSYIIFDDTMEVRTTFNERATFKKLRGFAYLCPFERYKLVKPFVVAEGQAQESQNLEVKEQETAVTTEAKSSERTDDERIASIRDHFVHLSKKFSEELQAQKQKEEEEKEAQRQQQSLIQMGGTRKRKRVEDSEQTEEFILPSDDLRCPIPNMEQNTYATKKSRKRKYAEMNRQQEQTQKPFNQKRKKIKPNRQQQNKGPKQPQQQQPQHTYFNEEQTNVKQEGFNRQQQNQSQPNVPKKKRILRRSPRNLQNRQFQEHEKVEPQQHFKQEPQDIQQHHDFSQQQNIQHDSHFSQQQNPNGQKKRQHERSLRYKQIRQQQEHMKVQRQQHFKQEDIQQHHEFSQQQYVNQAQRNFQQDSHFSQQQQNPNGQKKKQRGYGRSPKNKQNYQQNRRNVNTRNDTNFQPYDYASVDFRQFQGGAGAASSGVQIKSKFKSKNWKNNNRKGAKSASFGNARPNRGHQGGNF